MRNNSKSKLKNITKQEFVYMKSDPMQSKTKQYIKVELNIEILLPKL